MRHIDLHVCTTGISRPTVHTPDGAVTDVESLSGKHPTHTDACCCFLCKWGGLASFIHLSRIVQRLSDPTGTTAVLYHLLRAVRKFNRPSETYQTLEGYGILWLKMFGACVVYGENFGVREWPLRSTVFQD